MNWFKIQVDDRRRYGYTFIGCSEDTLEELIRKADSGAYIRLDQMLYMDRGEIKEWEKWDPNLIPSIFLNPSKIVNIMQFKDDPRNFPPYKK